MASSVLKTDREEISFFLSNFAVRFEVHCVMNYKTGSSERQKTCQVTRK